MNAQARDSAHPSLYGLPETGASRPRGRSACEALSVPGAAARRSVKIRVGAIVAWIGLVITGARGIHSQTRPEEAGAIPSVPVVAPAVRAAPPALPLLASG